MSAPTMFRARALRRISSPEQLDRLVQVTSPRTWLGLGALLLVVAGVLAWSILTTVPTTVHAQGYYLPLNGLWQVQSPASGTISAFSVTEGSHVVAGGPVAEISGPGSSSVEVRAPETGTITQYNVAVDSVVQQGQRLALLEPAGWPSVVYAYVPTEEAAGLPPGTPARVSFGGGVGAAFGFAKGRVESVSKFPTTVERLEFILGGSHLAQSLQSRGPVNEVVVELDLSATSANWLAWEQGNGPPGLLPTGLPASVEFVVGSHRPIDNVL